MNQQELDTRFEFRTIEPEEIEEAITIEQICFPPNEACSAEAMRARVKVAADLFLVAIDRENGKMAGFLTESQRMKRSSGMSFSQMRDCMIRMER